MIYCTRHAFPLVEVDLRSNQKMVVYIINVCATTMPMGIFCHIVVTELTVFIAGYDY